MLKAAYIHIPFCHHICHYCDFNKVFMARQPVEDYLLSLKKEMGISMKENPVPYFRSVFVGGGTPTALDERQLELLVESIHEILPYDQQTEYTFEANPGDLSKEKLRILKAAGVNRLSFGVQSFNDDLLKKIGRSHRAEDVFKSIHEAQDIGFENISVDLIYSLPGQTIEDFEATLKTALDLELVHYSGYSLIIEPKTVFYNLLNKGKLRLPGEDIEARMYEMLMDKMEARGLKQYEISNFAIPGFESYHNLTYWNNDEYFGFGAGAHSYVNGYRRSNYGPLKKYMDPLNEGNLPLMDNHLTTKSERMEEEMFLGLRKTEGVSIPRFTEKFQVNPEVLFVEEIKDLTARKLLVVDENHIKLTRNGRLLGNEVFQSFLGISND
ncbi:radical SAM family heme chaperone HemW [Mesobacillus maritimus]|uniref:radical SAM family heme chaperone HemW n=1 Tax=Mesobacillus maritimus TaxID=1643336 RepID=UPI002040AF69|nr:radical SAM family heme chaperone HemW [Mesobacillus maritimus]MCM3586274.1 radical SAM family heme chaperone HemW [Mesobacillus maritimus]MCM3671670.1 radical SAM family heme chaperone HemW [Mesobacillus maritimus]